MRVFVCVRAHPPITSVFGAALQAEEAEFGEGGEGGKASGGASAGPRRSAGAVRLSQLATGAQERERERERCASRSSLRVRNRAIVYSIPHVPFQGRKHATWRT